MSWIMEFVIGICLVAATAGVAFRSKKYRLLSLLVLIGIAFAIWSHAVKRDYTSSEPALVINTSTTSENLSGLIESQQRLMKTTERLEAAVANLDPSQPTSKLGWPLEIALGICLIIVAGGLANYWNIRSKQSKKSLKSDHAKKIDQRLGVLEQRITDLQDVMINIDDKLGRQELSPNLPKES